MECNGNHWNSQMPLIVLDAKDMNASEGKSKEFNRTLTQSLKSKDSTGTIGYQECHWRSTIIRGYLRNSIQLNWTEWYPWIPIPSLDTRDIIQNQRASKVYSRMSWNSLIALNTYRTHWWISLLIKWFQMGSRNVKWIQYNLSVAIEITGFQVSHWIPSHMIWDETTAKAINRF